MEEERKHTNKKYMIIFARTLRVLAHGFGLKWSPCDQSRSVLLLSISGSCPPSSLGALKRSGSSEPLKKDVPRPGVQVRFDAVALLWCVRGLAVRPLASKDRVRSQLGEYEGLF